MNGNDAVLAAVLVGAMFVGVWWTGLLDEPNRRLPPHTPDDVERTLELREMREREEQR